MLMREPGSLNQLGSSLPTYEQEIEPDSIAAAVPFQLSPVALAELHTLPRELTYRGQLDREYAEARGNISHWLGRTALVPATAVTLFFFDQQTVAPLVWGSNDVASVHHVASNANRSDGLGTTVLTTGGMGHKKSDKKVAEPLIPSLSEHIPNSQLFALEEGTFLHLPDTYTAVRNMLEENPTSHLVLWGMSMGGLESLFIAADLREIYPDLKITIFLDSTPFNTDTAYQLRNDPNLVGQSELMADLQLYGGPITNSAVDIMSSSTRNKYIRDDGWIDRDAYWAEWERIFRDIWNADGTPTSLRVGQVAVIASNSARENLTAIAADNPKLPPITVAYIANGNDTTVDVEKALAQFRSACNDLDMRFVVMRHPGLPHASENDFADIYNQSITIELDRIAYADYQHTQYLHFLDKLNQVASSIAAK